MTSRGVVKCYICLGMSGMSAIFACISRAINMKFAGHLSPGIVFFLEPHNLFNSDENSATIQESTIQDKAI